MATFDAPKVGIIQFVKFCAVGVLNTAVGLGIIFSLKYFFKTPDAHANLAGYLLGVCVSYVLNGIFTFKADRVGMEGFGKFLLVFVVAYSMNLLTTMLVIKTGLASSYLAHVVGVVPYTLISFAGGKYFVYRGSANA